NRVEDNESSVIHKPLIVIDPGHGGIDGGAIINNVLEKDLNLEISLKLKVALETAGYEVIMTRVDDEYIELTQRAEIANEAGADLFISLHLNSYISDSTVNGVEVYYNETTKSEADQQFAQTIQTALSVATKARDRGIRVYDELVVTRKTEMPACLVEIGFMTNPTELELIQTDTNQRKIVSGIVLGIEQFLETKEME
ncbi:MAG: N-acetylmuramoyl-L-alanine amidase family protein, partial [Turicibacter sp.]